MRWVKVGVGFAFVMLLVGAPAAPAQPTDGRTSRVFPEDGLNTGVTVHAVSGDGRWLAYEVLDPDGLASAEPLNRVMFVRDLQSGMDHRATPPGASFRFAGMSDDGSAVALHMSEDVAAAGDANGQGDGFVWHRSTGALTLVTVSSTGAAGDRQSEPLGLSADGTRVLFTSVATNFAPGAGLTGSALYVRDLTAGTTTLVNVLPDGTPGPQPRAMALSADGTKVVFASLDDAYVAGDPVGGAFIRDMATGVITRASVRIDGTPDRDVHMLALDGDGSHVAWSWNGNIKVRDLGAGVTAQAEPSAGFLLDLGLSAGGRFLTWHTVDDKAVVQDLSTGLVRLVSVTDGGEKMAAGGPPALTADGTRAFFSAHWPAEAGIADAYVHEIGVPPASTCSSGGAQQGQVSGLAYDVTTAVGLAEAEAAEANCEAVVAAGL